MKRFGMIFIFAVASLILVSLWSCEGEKMIQPEADFTETLNIGEIHNEFLARAFENMDKGSGMLTAAQKEDILYHTAKEITDKHGVPSLSRQEVSEALELGREMAKMNPDEMVRSVLSPKQYQWWVSFSSRATPEDARRVYHQVCAEHGAPEAGTILNKLVEISIHSAEFWVEKRVEDEPQIDCPYNREMLGGWKKNLLRFTVIVVTDAVTGAIGAGGSGGNAAVGAVIGGLCSYAVDDILFGG